MPDLAKWRFWSIFVSFRISLQLPSSVRKCVFRRSRQPRSKQQQRWLLPAAGRRGIRPGKIGSHAARPVAEAFVRLALEGIARRVVTLSTILQVFQDDFLIGGKTSRVGITNLRLPTSSYLPTDATSLPNQRRLKKES